jgi:hypothetical protein
MDNNEIICKESIASMLKKSQTKVIFPIITLGLLKTYVCSGKYEFNDSEVRKIYSETVAVIQDFVGHKLHTGGKYYDAYPIRNLPRYGVLVVHGKVFQISDIFKENAQILVNWIPHEIKKHIESKLGIIPTLGDNINRLSIASDSTEFHKFILNNMSINASNFEVFSFAIIKVHLEKFACRIYRDTRTSSNDKGVDLSTDFGVVYQIKNLKLLSKGNANEVLSEIKSNFDIDRIADGKVVLIIDDISKDVKDYLIDMKIQSISKENILCICSQFNDVEDRMKVLRIIYDEFRREYESQI